MGVVLDTFEIPLAYGGYEVAYSKVNHHIFVRASVCCTCGFVGSDLGEDCGRYGSSNVTITTGPSAGTVTEGQCGRCDGLAGVDTLGVMEFDPNTDKFIASHVMPDGTGGDPFGSPDGRHIVLVGNNGGEVLRILAAGEPGVASTVAFDLQLGFSNFEEEDSAVFNDAEMTARRSRRQVEWVVGTKYVWIDGTGGEEVYVLDVDKKEMVKTIAGITTTKMLSVENYAAKRTADLISQQIIAAIADIPEPTVTQIETASSSSDSSDKAAVVAQLAAVDEDEDDDDNDIDAVGIAALVVGLCALIVGIANMIYMSRSKSSDEGGNDGADSVDVKTLGSKNVA